jgi:predicted RND superfamily exporter protein
MKSPALLIYANKNSKKILNNHRAKPKHIVAKNTKVLSASNNAPLKSYMVTFMLWILSQVKKF